MSDKLFSNLKKEMESSSHFKDLKYKENSKNEVLRKAYIYELIDKGFVFLVSIFLLILFLTNDGFIEFLYLNSLVYFLIVATVLAAVYWGATKLDEWMNVLPFHIGLRLIASGLILVFFAYQLFTPHFYSDDYLERVGVETIEAYFQLANEELSDEERREIAEATLTEMMAFSTLTIESYPMGELVGIDAIEMSRNYYRYDLTVEVEQRIDTRSEKNTYRFEFDRENGEFKIVGYQMLN